MEHLISTPGIDVNIMNLVSCTVMGTLANHVYVNIVPTMLVDLFYTLQHCCSPLHLAAKGSHNTCVEHLLSMPGIHVNIQDEVSWSI